jgi:hypothetical protein
MVINDVKICYICPVNYSTLDKTYSPVFNVKKTLLAHEIGAG